MIPKTFDDLMMAILSVCPKAELDDLDGQIIVYTGLQDDGDGNLSELTDEDFEGSDVEDDDPDGCLMGDE